MENVRYLTTAIPASPKEVTIEKEKNRRKTKYNNNIITVGKTILLKVPDSIMLSSKMDFKARMIPLLFLADHLELQNSFSIHDVQVIMYDVLGEKVEKNKLRMYY